VPRYTSRGHYRPAVSVRDGTRSAWKRPTPGLQVYSVLISLAGGNGWRSASTKLRPSHPVAFYRDIRDDLPAAVSRGFSCFVGSLRLGRSCRSYACRRYANFIAGDDDGLAAGLSETTRPQMWAGDCPTEAAGHFSGSNNESRKIARPQQDGVAVPPLRARSHRFGPPIGTTLRRAAFCPRCVDRRDGRRRPPTTRPANWSTMKHVDIPRSSRPESAYDGTVSGPAGVGAGAASTPRGGGGGVGVGVLRGWGGGGGGGFSFFFFFFGGGGGGGGAGGGGSFWWCFFLGGLFLGWSRDRRQRVA